MTWPQLKIGVPHKIGLQHQGGILNDLFEVAYTDSYLIYETGFRIQYGGWKETNHQARAGTLPCCCLGSFHVRCPVLWSHLCAVIKNRAHDNSHNLVHVHLSKSVVTIYIALCKMLEQITPLTPLSPFSPSHVRKQCGSWLSIRE